MLNLATKGIISNNALEIITKGNIIVTIEIIPPPTPEEPLEVTRITGGGGFVPTKITKKVIKKTKKNIVYVKIKLNYDGKEYEEIREINVNKIPIVTVENIRIEWINKETPLVRIVR